MSFSRDVFDFVDKTKAKADKRVRATCLQITADAVNGTPVDKGRLQGNWQSGINSVPSGVLEGSDKSGGRAIASAQPDIRQAPGNIYKLANNLPYAVVVEFGQFGNPAGSANSPKTVNGFSRQAPAGMARLAVQRAKESLR